MASNQSNRRHSFPIQNKAHCSLDDDTITILGPLDIATTIFPLTEENLAIHTQNYPANKDTRRHHARIFVENQRPVIEMEMMLEEQREQEISSFSPILFDENINFSNPFMDQQVKKKNWLNKLTHWIRSDSSNHDSKEDNKRQRSRSAVSELDRDHTKEICQKRDSGISFFHQYTTAGKRRSSSIARSSKFVPIPIVRQPKFSPPVNGQQQREQDEFIAFKYPKMVRKSGGHITTNEKNSCSNNLNSLITFGSHYPTNTTDYLFA